MTLAVCWFYTWVPGSFHRHWLTSRPEGFYNELADGFLARQTSLLRQPDPRLMALADPYDPALNAPYRVNDLSYFQGHYYLYMGPAPAFTVFIPVRLLTGRYLTENAACSLLCIVGAVASVALLLDLRRRYQPTASNALLVSSVFAIAMGDGYYAVARGTIAQQVTIANAYAFAMLALWGCGRATGSTRRPRAWFAFSSLCLGIAISSRPNYVFASIALVPPFLYWIHARADSAMDCLKTAAGVALPLGAAVATLLTYNDVRFGHFLEFGQRYQLGGWNQLKLSSSGLGHGWENAWRYLLAPALYSRYFPFVSAPTWIAVSVLRHVPWLWLLPLAAWALLQRTTPRAIRALGASALILSVTNLLTLIFLPSGNPAAVLTSANARYVLDFLPGLTLFVALGAMAAFQPAGLGSRLANRVWVLAAASLCAASVVIALSLDIGAFPSESYRGLAYALNLPGYAVELARGDAFGPLSMNLSFPPNRTGAYEPLVSTGTAASTDLLFVNYTSPTQVRFGFVSTDMKGPMSDPVTVGYGKPLHLEISMGSLYPPNGHPSWISIPNPAVAYLRRHLLVVLDGRKVFDVQAHFDPASPEEVTLGASPFLKGYSSESFAGKIISSRREPISVPAVGATSAPRDGAVRLVIRFPDHPAVDLCEPLVTTGVPRAGDIVYVRYLPEGRVSFGIDHWGGAGFTTDPITASPKDKHTVEISIGSLSPSLAHGSQVQHAAVSFDGKTLFDGDQDTYDSSPYDVAVGTNPIGGSTCAYSFSGRILSVERLGEK